MDGRFTKYSYDSRINLKLYGSRTAPKYNLKNVQTPTKIFVGESDFLSTVENAQKLSNELPNSLGYHVIEKPEWNHMDFAFSQYAKSLVFDHLISDMKNIRDSNSLDFQKCNHTSTDSWFVQYV